MLGRLTKKTGAQADAKNWYKDRYESAVVWRNILAVLTFASLLLAAAAVITVQQLTPSKTVEPFLIQVEDKTGLVQMVDPKKAKELTANESVNNYFLTQYLKAREGYDSNYQIYNNSVVRLMSSPEIYRAFRVFMSTENPESPLVRLGYVGSRSIAFRSITYIAENTVQVRFSVLEKANPSDAPRTINRIALIKFDYNLKVLSQQDRFVNPLGFQITSYRVDEESLR